MAQGIRATSWPARLQKLGAGPLTELLRERTFLLDGGHNPDAANALALYLEDKADKPIEAVIGMMAAKDARRFLSIIAPQLASLTAVPIPGNDCLAPDVLADLAREAGVADVATAEDVPSALYQLGDGGTVLICGSLYLAGKVLELNRELPD